MTEKNVQPDWAVTKDDCHSPEKEWGVDNRPELVEVIGKNKIVPCLYPWESGLFSQTDYTYLQTVSCDLSLCHKNKCQNNSD